MLPKPPKAYHLSAAVVRGQKRRDRKRKGLRLLLGLGGL